MAGKLDKASLHPILKNKVESGSKSIDMNIMLISH